MERQFLREFQWDARCERTPEFNIPVRMPCWLDPADYQATLENIDRQWFDFAEVYEWARENFDPSRYVVYIHDSPGAFVAGVPGGESWWVLGWQIERYVCVAWGLARDEEGHPDGPSTRDILPALSHEWLHAVLAERYGCPDAGHCIWYPSDICRRAMLMPRLKALVVPLSKKTQAAFRLYRYFPWCVPQSVA